MKNKWILFGVAIVLMAINLLNADFSAFKQLSPADFGPVIVITAVSFLLKTGAVTTVLIGLKKLWKKPAGAIIDRPSSHPPVTKYIFSSSLYTRGLFAPLAIANAPMICICNIFDFRYAIIMSQEVRQ